MCEHASANGAFGFEEVWRRRPGGSSSRCISCKIAAFDLLDDMFELVWQVSFHVQVVSKRNQGVKGSAIAKQNS